MPNLYEIVPGLAVGLDGTDTPNGIFYKNPGDGSGWTLISTGGDGLPSTDDLSAIANTNATAANVAMNSHKITSLANGSVSSDAAAFGQIPTSAATIGGLLAANNLSDVGDAGTSRFNAHVPDLTPAATVFTANVSALSGLPTNDGYTVVNSDLILLTAQTTASQNGLWQAPASGSGAWARPTEFPTTGQVKGSRTIKVVNGTVYGLSSWTLIVETGSPVTIDTTAQTWTKTPTSSVIENDNQVAASGSGTVTIPDVTTDTIDEITLTGNPTLAFPAGAAGKSFTLMLTQDATGSRTVTWPATSILVWPSGATPTLTTAASKTDVLSFVWSAQRTLWLGFVGGENF